MASSKHALALARKKWGKTAFVRENKRSLTATQRAELWAQIRAMRVRMKEIEAEQKALGHNWQTLLTASEFFLEVNGDEPSGTQFREAVAKARKWTDLGDELSSLRKEDDRLIGGMHRYRWEAGHIQTVASMQWASIGAHADSLSELIEKIEGRSNVDENVAVGTES